MSDVTMSIPLPLAESILMEDEDYREASLPLNSIAFEDLPVPVQTRI